MRHIHAHIKADGSGTVSVEDGDFSITRESSYASEGFLLSECLRSLDTLKAEAAKRDEPETTPDQTTPEMDPDDIPF